MSRIIKNASPPPLNRLAAAAAAMALFWLLAGAAQAQTTCNNSICTITLARVGSPVVDGCGEHATPGRMKIIFSSTDSSVTRASFPVAGYFIQAASEFWRPAAFSDWEWRAAFLNGGRWSDPAGNRIGFAGGVLGENIIEVRPKAGAHIWSNRNAANPIQGPGELVVQVFDLPAGSSTQYRAPGEPYFLFMGGKGCARVNEGGEDIGGVQ